MIFDIIIDEENLKQNIINISSIIKPEWKKEIENMKIVNLNGGITNRLVACYLNQNGLDTSDTLLFRMYGKNTEKFISRENEISTMQLMKKQDIGPEFYCKFLNGICYEYLPGKIIDQKLIFEEKVSRKIAEAVASLHFVNFEEAQVFKKSGRTPFIFPKIYELLNLVNEDYKTNMPHMTDEFLKKIPSTNSLLEEIKFLENHLVNYTKQNDSMVLFSHNDLLLGNIIYNDSENSIKFIDYEYGEYNYQAYDLANHFNEFSGVEEPDYSFYPDKQYQIRWF
jgi:ethanolamine kinase